MKDLSALEANLVYAVQQEPGRTLTYYGDQLRTQHTQMTRALERLMRFGYLHREDNRLTISESFKKDDTDAELDRVEKAAERRREAAAVDRAEDQLRTKPAPVKAAVESAEKKPQIKVDESRATRGDVLAFLSDGAQRTAAEIAKHFGMKSGHSVGQLLRLLTGEGSVVKIGTLYQRKASDALAEALKVEVATKIAKEIVARDTPAEPEPKVAEEFHTLTEQELRAEILKCDGAFTTEECFTKLSDNHAMLRELFDIVFEDVAASGAMTAWDGEEFVDPRNDYAPTHKFIVLRIVEAKESFKILDDYCRLIPAPYNLFEIVRMVRLPPAEVLSYLYDMGYDTKNPSSMIKANIPYYPNRKEKRQIAMGTQVTGFKKIEELDPENIKRFLMGGVKTDVFINRFKLDPSKRNTVIEALLITNIAKHDKENDWLILHPDATVNLKMGDPGEPEETVNTEETAHDRLRKAAERFVQSLGGAATDKDGFVLADAIKQTSAIPLTEVIMSPDVAEELGIPVDELEHEAADAHSLNDEEIQAAKSQPEIGVLSTGIVAMTRENFEKAQALGADVTLYQEIPDSDMVHVWVGADDKASEETNEPEPKLCRCGRDHSNDEPVDLEKVAAEVLDQIMESEDRLIKEIVSKSLDYGSEEIVSGYGEDILITANAKITPDDLIDSSTVECGCDFGGGCKICDPDLYDTTTEDPEKPEVIEEYRSGRLPDGPTGSRGHIGPRGPGFIRMDPPNPQWVMTLQMMEERLRFEHQYTQANQLKEIREYLEKP